MQPNYTIVLSPTILQKIKAYQQTLLKDSQSMGNYLYQILKRENLSSLSLDAFLEKLLHTKQPQIFAESHIKGNGSDWNLTELSILGDVSIAVPVTIFDNGAHRHPLIHKQAFEGTLVFTAGALLRNDSGYTPADWKEVTQNKQFYYPGYYQLYERRLMPVFDYINQQATQKAAVVSIPGLGCGMFAGPFKGLLGAYLERVLCDMLKQHGDRWSNIRAVYYDPYNECKNQRHRFHNIDLLVRPLTAGNTGKSQLSTLDQLEDQPNEFDQCQLFSIVAWDHVSWPGNDFYVGSRATDDGVKAAATSSMYGMTGIEGTYDYKLCQYQPPAPYQTWNGVIIQNNLSIQVADNLFIS